MKIYSWNISDRNEKLDQAFHFIQQLEFDVLCLQEVPETFLKRLQILSYNCIFDIDLQRLFPYEVRTDYLVILTPHQIVKSKTFVTSQGLKQPWRTRCLVHLLKPFGWSPIGNHGGLYADIQLPEMDLPTRVFSVHLRLDSPTERRKEFDIVSGHLSTAYSNIVCGDFNVIDNSWLKPFSWLMGSSLRESTPWYPERTILEEIFNQHGLKNPLRGEPTHTLFSNQLDHILVSKYTKIKKTTVFVDSLGSDHYPVSVSVEM